MRLLATQSNTYMDPVVMIMQMGVDEQTYDEKLKSLMGMTVRNIGAKGVIGVDVHSSLPHVCRVLSNNHLKKVPVLDDGRIVGVINRSDITQYSMKVYLDGQLDVSLTRELARETKDAGGAAEKPAKDSAQA